MMVHAKARVSGRLQMNGDVFSAMIMPAERYHLTNSDKPALWRKVKRLPFNDGLVEYDSPPTPQRRHPVQRNLQ